MRSSLGPGFTGGRSEYRRAFPDLDSQRVLRLAGSRDGDPVNTHCTTAVRRSSRFSRHGHKMTGFRFRVIRADADFDSAAERSKPRR